MPKMKTKRAAAKRFSRTAGGKIRRNKAYMRHCLGHKSPTQRRNLRRRAVLQKGDAGLIAACIPYA